MNQDIGISNRPMRADTAATPEVQLNDLQKSMAQLWQKNSDLEAEVKQLRALYNVKIPMTQVMNQISTIKRGAK